MNVLIADGRCRRHTRAVLIYEALLVAVLAAAWPAAALSSIEPTFQKEQNDVTPHKRPVISLSDS